MNENKYLVFLHSLGLTHNDLFQIFGESDIGAKGFFEELSETKLREYISSQSRRQGILQEYDRINTRKLEKTLENLGVEIICYGDQKYPESLKNTPHAPYLLYIRGSLPKQEMFGVVGSRKITSYGKKSIEKIIPDIAKVFPIVSGGAAGCDSEAHKIALKSGGTTVVVVGTGIDQTYPVSNAGLFNEIVDSGGAIISIFRIGEPGNPYNFPVRNEVVVGLSRGILIVEAQEKSGSLITAGLCLDLGKDLFSIPGDIHHSSSVGTNMLIKKGEAKCITTSYDILEEYDVLVKKTSHKNQIPLLDTQESRIYTAISEKQVDVDSLSNYLKLNPSEVMIKLSLLELKGVIKKDITGKYILR